MEAVLMLGLYEAKLTEEPFGACRVGDNGEQPDCELHDLCISTTSVDTTPEADEIDGLPLS